MKSLFLLIAVAISTVCQAQTASSQDALSMSWDNRISADFYSKINNGRRFDCCEAKKKSKHVEVRVDLPDQCYARMDFSLGRYSEESIDSTIIVKTVDALDKKYRQKFSARKRAHIARSCFSAYVAESIIEDVYQDVVFISGQLKIIVCFQMD
jgi:hypothetical protein